MAVNTKAIKRRMKSVKNTKKITKAMELVSAAKMRKAVQAALDTRTYATLARELMEHLAHIDEPKYDLLRLRPVKRILVVLMSSNRGLCGSFNSNIFKRASALLDDKMNIARHRVAGGEDIEALEEPEIHILGIGKKSAWFAKRNNYHLEAVFDQLGDKPNIESIAPVSKMLIDSYLEGKYDKIVVTYSDYKSSLLQEAKVRQLLPLSSVDIEKMIAGTGGDKHEALKKNEDEDEFSIDNYLFEPTIEEIVEYVLPRLVEIQLYQALLESSASEHSSRMMAMRTASDAAGDMIDSLSLSFNKARQAAITQEIAEIASGAQSLNG